MKNCWLLACLLFGIACGSEKASDEEEKSTKDDDSKTASEMVCKVNDSTDGTNACGLSQTCNPGTFCHDQTKFCVEGCRTELDCAKNQYCDMRNKSRDVTGKFDVGTCRAPGSECGSDDDSSDGIPDSCDDVQGNYRVILKENSPSPCRHIWSQSRLCSIAQDACDLTLRCDDGSTILPRGTLDKNNRVMSSFEIQGHTIQCKLIFGQGFSWSCTAEGIVCEGYGLAQ